VGSKSGRAWYVNLLGVLFPQWHRIHTNLISTGLTKAEYAVGYFTEMGIGCRRDPLEANVWYVKAADAGDERAQHRLSAIRAAMGGADPVEAAAADPKKRMKKRSTAKLEAKQKAAANGGSVDANAEVRGNSPKSAKDEKDCIVM
jgi:TPR repeat protein